MLRLNVEPSSEMYKDGHRIADDIGLKQFAKYLINLELYDDGEEVHFELQTKVEYY